MRNYISLTKLFRLGISLFLYLHIVNLNAQDINWLESYGGLESDGSTSICADQFGNTYITGYFRSQADFNNNHLVSTGDTDIFVAKIDENGSLQWVYQYGSETSKNIIVTELGTSITCNSSGDVFVAGIFSQSATFGDTIINSNGGDDIFVLKINNRGRLDWVANYGSSTHDYVYDIEVDKNGKIIISALMGKMPYNLKSSDDSEGSYAIISTVNNSGNIQIIKSIYSDNFIEPKTITFDNNENIYWVVNFDNTIYLGNDKIESKGKTDILITKFSDIYKEEWIKHIGSKNYEKINQIDNLNNEILFVGTFENRLNVDKHEVISHGKSDFLIGCISDRGNVSWLNNFGGIFEDVGISISSLEQSFIVGGVFQDEVFSNKDTLISYGSTDIAIIEYNETHSELSSKKIGNIDTEYLSSLYCRNNLVYLTGTFRSDLVTEKYYIESKGSNDIFVIPYQPMGVNTFNSKSLVQLAITTQPNPSSGYVFLNSNVDGFIYADIKVINTLGEIVINKNKMLIPGKIDLRKLVTGTYYINIEYNNESVLKKIVIKN